MQFTKEEILKAVENVRKFFFEDIGKQKTPFVFLFFVAWKSFPKERDEGKMVNLMETAFEKAGFPKDLPVFLFYYLTGEMMKNDYTIAIPLPKGTSSKVKARTSYFFVPQGSAINVVPGEVLSPASSRNCLSQIYKFIGKDLDDDGANCLGTVSFEGGEIFVALTGTYIDITAYGEKKYAVGITNP